LELWRVSGGQLKPKKKNEIKTLIQGEFTVRLLVKRKNIAGRRAESNVKNILCRQLQLEFPRADANSPPLVVACIRIHKSKCKNTLALTKGKSAASEPTMKPESRAHVLVCCVGLFIEQLIAFSQCINCMRRAGTRRDTFRV
jgi:hypothetical protein